jgi:hypothetical protein
MLPELPRALNFDFDPDPVPENSQSGAASPTNETTSVDHHYQVCTTYSHRLAERHCKLVCTHCGYYISCADYC